MKLPLAIILAGAAAAAPAFFFQRTSCERAYTRTRVTLDFRDSTLRALFRDLQRQTGFPVVAACPCGALQEIVDQPRLTLRVREISAWNALKLGSVQAGLWGHCGSWYVQGDRVVLRCGLIRK